MKVGILLQRSRAVVGVRQRGVRVGAPIGVQTRRIYRWIDQAERIPFRKKSVLILNADLDVVNATYVRHARAGAGIGEPAILTDGRGLEIGRKVGEGVSARIIVVLILPHKSAESEYSLGIQEMSPDRSDIKRSDLRTLIRGADQYAIGTQAAIIYQQAVPAPWHSGRRKNWESGTRSG